MAGARCSLVRPLPTPKWSPTRYEWTRTSTANASRPWGGQHAAPFTPNPIIHPFTSGGFPPPKVNKYPPCLVWTEIAVFLRGRGGGGSGIRSSCHPVPTFKNCHLRVADRAVSFCHLPSDHIALHIHLVEGWKQPNLRTRRIPARGNTAESEQIGVRRMHSETQAQGVKATEQKRGIQAKVQFCLDTW